MQEEEAIKLLNKVIKVHLSNAWTYHGKVLSVDEEQITILDKFQKKVSIKLNKIDIFEVQA